MKCQVFLLLAQAVVAFANTEILYFTPEPVEDQEIHFLYEWPSLNAGYHSLRWDLASNPPNLSDLANQQPCGALFKSKPDQPASGCLHELWILLEFDSPDWGGGTLWADYTRFTLRLSWPASHPMDAYLRIFEPSELASLPRPGRPRRARSASPLPKTRTKYARLQLFSNAVFTPQALQSNATQDIVNQVPIVLALEPMVFGLFAESLVPTIATLLIAALIGLIIARTVVGYLEFVTQAPSKEPTKKD